MREVMLAEARWEVIVAAHRESVSAQNTSITRLPRDQDGHPNTNLEDYVYALKASFCFEDLEGSDHEPYHEEALNLMGRILNPFVALHRYAIKFYYNSYCHTKLHVHAGISVTS